MDKRYIVIEVGDNKPVVFMSTEPKEGGYCFGCVFYEGELERFCNAACALQRCVPAGREDNKHVIWVKA